MNRDGSGAWLLAPVIALSMLAAGCVATLSAGTPNVGGYDVAYAEAVPVDVNMYPAVEYRGRLAYLVEGRWYWPTDNGWVVFVEEPPELTRYRTNVQTAPRAVPPPAVEYGYPPVRPTKPREIHREYRPH
ncbi:hypothetical protein [Polyangium mundeleinium]|uniref:Lipoprotein n=1 Tax=Polyangium mundeleinium TaxID=2995306 RepID=A0ABT5F5T9_9BACT|nr:hypothetical protein [Polyangium mundeleinium]MDC0748989.1 hypothetical protein [Polyangium mundeleinium]